MRSTETGILTFRCGALRHPGMTGARASKMDRHSPSLLCMFTNSLIGSLQRRNDPMRDNCYDRTIERNYLQKWRFLIPEYEAVKAGRSPLFKRVGDFYRHHGTCSQTFRKYYNRYLQSGEEADLLPRRRGPKWRERREPEGIEAEIVAHRKRGMNRYEI